MTTNTYLAKLAVKETFMRTSKMDVEKTQEHSDNLAKHESSVIKDPFSEPSLTYRLIELFQQSEAVWNHKSSAYHVKGLRVAQTKAIADALGSTPKIIENKLKSLRTQFNREYTKIIQARMRGEHRKPRWQYYERLSFLLDIINVQVNKHGNASAATEQLDQDINGNETVASPASDDTTVKLETSSYEDTPLSDFESIFNGIAASSGAETYQDVPSSTTEAVNFANMPSQFVVPGAPVGTPEPETSPTITSINVLDNIPSAASLFASAVTSARESIATTACTANPTHVALYPASPSQTDLVQNHAQKRWIARVKPGPLPRRKRRSTERMTIKKQLSAIQRFREEVSPTANRSTSQITTSLPVAPISSILLQTVAPCILPTATQTSVSTPHIKPPSSNTSPISPGENNTSLDDPSAVQLLQTATVLLSEAARQKTDECAQYAEYLATEMRKLNERQRDKLKCRLSMLLYEIKYEDDCKPMEES